LRNMKIDFGLVAKLFGTPTYVYDAFTIRERIGVVRKVFKGFDFTILFALKANNNPVLLRLMADMDVGADVVSPGELVASHRAGMRPVLWNGNGKTEEQKCFFLEQGFDLLSIDSIEELEMWQDTAIPRLLRVNPNVDARTHPHISTGLKHHKFGVDIEELEKVAEKIDGLHVHIGSQVTSVEPYEAAYSRLVRACREFGLHTLDLGGGWGIDYNGEYLDTDKMREMTSRVFSRFDGKLLIEPGRFITGPAGFLLAKVLRVKKGEKTFIVTDAGMNDLIRPALYNAHHRIRILEPAGPAVSCDVVGPLCETGDKLAADRILELPTAGSLLVVEDAGAYGFSMASNYNSMPLPAEVIWDDSGPVLIRKRQTIEDMYSNVIGP